MSARFFSITAKDPGPLTSGKAEVTLTVTNVSGHPLRGQVWLNAIGTTKREWLRISGDSEKDFEVNETHSFTVQIEVPADVPAGTYTFRPVVASFQKPNEEFDEGQMVAFQVEPQVTNGKKGVPWWVWVAAGVVILAVGVGALIWMLSGGEQVKIPKLAGESAATAKATLEKLCEPEPCLQVTVREEESSQAAAGSVIRTDPAEGEEIEPGKDVTLVVSSGSPGITLPDLAGKNEAEARKTLEQLCEKPRPCVHVFSNTEPSDSVARGVAVKTDPPSGARVQPGAVVGLIISGGPSTVPVPDVSNLPEATARQRIENAGFQVFVLRRGDDEVGNGRVIETVPPASSRESPGSKVVIHVSQTISSGQRALLKQQTLDLDDGTVGGGTSAADLFFDVNARVLQAGFQGTNPRPNRFLKWGMSPLGASQCLGKVGGGRGTGRPGFIAEVLSKPMVAMVFAQGKMQIPLVEVRAGLHVCVVTTEGQVSGLQIVSVNVNPGREQLVVDYKTWPAPKSLSSVVIAGSQVIH